MKKILILGGSGFIGSHIVDFFIGEKYKVIIVDKFRIKHRRLKNSEASFYKIDARDRLKLEKIITKEKPQIICHHASALVSVQESMRNPLKALEDIPITANILEIARKNKIRQIIFSSSANVYSNEARIPIHEDSLLNPISPYGITKLATESYFNYIHNMFGVKTAIFRYFNVYGPRQKVGLREGIIPILIDSALTSKEIVISGDGTQSRDFIFVEDIARANYSAVINNSSGIFNVGTGKGTSINKLIKIISKIAGRQVKYRLSGKYNEINHSVADVSKIKYHLGWNAQVSIEEGLAKTFDYYKNLKRI